MLLCILSVVSKVLLYFRYIIVLCYITSDIPVCSKILIICERPRPTIHTLFSERRNVGLQIMYILIYVDGAVTQRN